MKKFIQYLLVLVLVFSLAACGTGATTITPAASGSTGSSTDVSSNTTTSTESSTVTSTASASVPAALAENSETHADSGDETWDSAAETAITLNGSSISAAGEGVTVEGSSATITRAGNYRISGTLDDGQIVVNTDDEEVVRLILDGATLSSSTGSPLAVDKAEKVVIFLADGSQNSVSDAASYVFASADVTEPNAAIFSAADLTLSGSGALTVTGNYNDGIGGKDGVIIDGGTITVSAKDDGIRGKDYLVISGGSISVDAQGDGLKSDNAEDATKGYVMIEGVTLNVTAGMDAIDAETDVMITSGDLTLTSGGGSGQFANGTDSAKGIKGTVSVNIDGGTFVINASDDAIHSNGSIVVNGGTFTLATGDDGMHADNTLEINGGSITIEKSYEGIESAAITINGGEINVTASDDGINAAGGNDGSGLAGPGGRDGFGMSGGYSLDVNGGTIYVNANGDGLDIGGPVTMTDGLVVVSGPTEQMNGALDYDGGFNISGGLIVAAGSSGMAEAPGATSSQNSLLVFFSATQPANTLVHIQNSQGETLLIFAPVKQFQSLAFSSPDLADGETYTVSLGGSVSGTSANGFFTDGQVTGGSKYAEFTVSSVVTQLGTGGMGGGGRGRRP